MSRVGAAAVLVAFALSLVGVVAAPTRAADGVEDPAVFVEALRAAAPELPPGTRVLVHPPWRDDVVDAIESAGVLPPGVTATVALAPRHGEDPGPLLVVQDLDAPPLPDALQARVDETTARDTGGLRLVRTKTGGSDDGGGISLADLLHEAAVEVQTADGRVTACRFEPARRRHVCPGLPEWMWVGEEPQRVGGAEQRCVWSHPTSNGYVRVRFPRVDVTRGLAFSHALQDHAAQNPAGAPVTAIVKVDGAEVGRLVTRQGRTGFDALRVPPGGRVDSVVEIEIATPNDGQRHYCWKAIAGEER